MNEPAKALAETLNRPGVGWHEVHATLARFGVTMEPKGSGMIVTTTLADGHTLAAKASQLGKWAGRAALEKKLGTYKPPTQNIPATESYEQAMRAQREHTGMSHGSDDPARVAKREARAAERKALASRFEKDQAGIRAGRKEQRSTLHDAHRAQRQALHVEMAAQWKQRRTEARVQHRDLKLERALWARESAMRLETLQKQQATERKTLATGPKSTVWREWLEQQAGEGDEAAKAALRGIRYREQRNSKKHDDALEGEDLEPQQELTVGKLRAEIDRKRMQVIYRSADGRERFVDTGPRIVIKDRERDSLEAALRVAAQKYGGRVNITGSAEFRERAARQATRLGIGVRDADLQAIVADERARIRPNDRSKNGMKR